MKTIFAKFRVGSELDERLKAEAPAASSPEDLHASIMRAVRTSRRVEERPQPGWLRLGPAFALAVLLATGICVGVKPLKSRQAVSEAHQMNAAIQMVSAGGSYARSMPAAAVAPMAAEWDKVNADLKHTASFLAACIP